MTQTSLRTERRPSEEFTDECEAQRCNNQPGAARSEAEAHDSTRALPDGGGARGRGHARPTGRGAEEEAEARRCRPCAEGGRNQSHQRVRMKERDSLLLFARCAQPAFLRSPGVKGLGTEI